MSEGGIVEHGMPLFRSRSGKEPMGFFRVIVPPGLLKLLIGEEKIRSARGRCEQCRTYESIPLLLGSSPSFGF
jgi:hypothetical protein